MNLHVHSAHRQRKALGCEHKKRVEKRWRITHADIRLGVYGPLRANDLQVKSMQRRDRQSCGTICANEAARMVRITRRELSV